MAYLGSPEARVLVAALSIALGGCASRSVPDPRDAARAYHDALKRGDTDAVYELMTSTAQRDHGREGTKRLIEEARSELLSVAEAVSKADAKVEANARVRFADGEEAELSLDDGRFRVAAAGTLPTGARTPAQALAELRRALARRSYAGLMRVLTEESRGALDADMRSLVDGLDEPSTLDVRIQGDQAEAILPGGHKVVLKRKAGIWRVEDFD
ncbi:MAG: hypothetical protein R3B13_28620 [Polyangiaceae bacterium]